VPADAAACRSCSIPARLAAVRLAPAGRSTCMDITGAYCKVDLRLAEAGWRCNTEVGTCSAVLNAVGSIWYQRLLAP
jgi:hypothetical protein